MEDSIAQALNNNLSTSSIVVLSERRIDRHYIIHTFARFSTTRSIYRCMCTSGYTGQNCENEYIPCNPSPCKNGGTCHQTDDLDYECICPEGEFWNCFSVSIIYGPGDSRVWRDVDDSAYIPEFCKMPPLRIIASLQNIF